jgi:hypothetical protein
MRKVLTTGLELGRGIRRWESYVNMIWMAPAPAEHRRPTPFTGRKGA